MRVRTAADVLEINPLLKRSVADLSGGEQQRVALARALVKNAEIYLFDEPLSNLDPRLRYQARREMMIVHRIKKKPSVYVTHDQLEAFAIANRIAMIADGKILQIGTPDQLYYKPANLFIAQFVGTPPMNIIPVHILHAEQRYSVQGDGIYFTLASRWKSILQGYGQPWAMLGIRPSTIIPEWAFSALDHSAYFLTYAQVLKIDPRISDTVVKLRIGASTEVNAVFDDNKESQLEVGRIINIGIHREQIYLFNPQSGELLNEAVL
jgi:multiple sugar transport system ATP-binding protein